MFKTPKKFIAPLALRVPGFLRKQHLLGAAPGTLSIPASAPPPQIRVIQYDAETVSDRQVKHVGELETLDFSTGITWIDVQGLGDAATIKAIAKQFSIHPLALEDMVNVPQRPKIVSYDSKLLWIMRMARVDDGGMIDREQLSLLHSDRVVITFQERPGDVLDPVRGRIKDGRGLIRKASADYLAYAILDSVVDGYYPIVEQLSSAMEVLEHRIMEKPEPQHLASINQMKWLSTTLKRSMHAQRQALGEFLENPSAHLVEANRIFFGDVLDHANQLSEILENQRDHLSGLLNTYLSMVSFRANEVMQLLTIMASIFIPLTFIAGIYGMNFQFMPELAYPWAYPSALALMLVLALGMVGYFVKKGWIGGQSNATPFSLPQSDETES